MTGGVALVLTTVAALGWRRALARALVGFVVEYAIALANRPPLDLRAPLVGAGMLLVGELASLAMNLATRPAPLAPGGGLENCLQPCVGFLRPPPLKGGTGPLCRLCTRRPFAA